jgi:hypothetical protein
MWREGNSGAAIGSRGVIEVDRQPGIRMVILRRDIPGRCFSSSPLNGQGRRRKAGKRRVWRVVSWDRSPDTNQSPRVSKLILEVTNEAR